VIPQFDGSDVTPADHQRLIIQIEAVRDLMLDGVSRTLGQISQELGHRYHQTFPEASVSAQLRNLRKPRYGKYQVTKRHCGSGLWKYQLVKPLPEERLF
jgi:hypothetical protein